MRILDMTYVQDIHKKKHWVKIWEEIYESFIQMLLLFKKKGRKTSELFKWVQIAHRYNLFREIHLKVTKCQNFICKNVYKFSFTIMNRDKIY